MIAGNECRVVDVAVHSSALRLAAGDPAYRAFLVELALSWLEQRFGVWISRGTWLFAFTMVY